MTNELFWASRANLSARMPRGIGEWRVWYLAAPEVRALRFALELNSHAIDSIDYARSGPLFDEGAQILESYVRKHGATFEHVEAVVGLLNNRGALRDLYEADPIEVLDAACEACERSVSFAREALASYHSEPSSAGQVGQLELMSLVVGSLISQSRALSDSGDLDSSRVVLAEARTLLDELRAGVPATAMLDLELHEEMMTDAHRSLDGSSREWKRSLWYRSPHSVL